MINRSPQLEICAETLQACSAAAEGGAHRIEICSALREGGVTPSHGLIRAALHAARGLPVFVLLRPRPGDFIYSQAEFQVMRADLLHSAELGVAGFVAGILTRERNIDVEKMGELVKLAAGKEVTFHRAIDHTRDVFDAVEKVIETGCCRILTAGGKPTVAEGLESIARLCATAAGRIRVAAGGGVNVQVARQLSQVADVDLHASLRRKAVRTAAVVDPLWCGEPVETGISVERVRALAEVVAERSLRGRFALE